MTIQGQLESMGYRQTDIKSVYLKPVGYGAAMIDLNTRKFSVLFKGAASEVMLWGTKLIDFDSDTLVSQIASAECLCYEGFRVGSFNGSTTFAFTPSKDAVASML